MTDPRATARPELTLDTADRLAAAALAGIEREYPHKLDHVMAGPGDAVMPRALHPSFHGSYDWHSCVHMHWLLARLRRRFPNLPSRPAIDALFDRNFGRDSVAAELAYLRRPDSGTFERPYGWAWLLKLAAALRVADDSDSQRWSRGMQPLADAFAARFVEFLPRARYPVRHGVHSNSAFALAFAIDYARIAGDIALERACEEKARGWYLEDRNAPAAWEPSGVDFLSPTLVELEVMRRVLDRDAYSAWLDGFLPEFAGRRPATLFEPAGVIDRSDAQLVHLDGLNLSRAWCFDGIAMELDAGDRRAVVAREAAEAHIAAGWRGLESDDFGGAHWLASFALLAVDR